MPNIYLGPSGSETLLPKITLKGNLSPLAIAQTRQYEKRRMLSGRTVLRVFSVNPKKWPFRWDNLTTAQMATFKALNAAEWPLHFQNNWESAAWTWVFIAAFDPEIDMEISTETDIRWSLNMTLEEMPA